MTLTPESLRADSKARDMLRYFDFTVQDVNEYDAVWFDITPLEPFDIIAQRSSGCVYALVGPERHVLLGTSEGQAGIMAANLTDLDSSSHTPPGSIDRLRCRVTLIQ
jgi:hypothetical protein